MAEKIRRKEIFGNVEIEAIYRETRRPAPQAAKKGKEDKEENWDGLEEKTLEGAGFGFCPPLTQRTYLAEDGIHLRAGRPGHAARRHYHLHGHLPPRRPDKHSRHHLLELFRQAAGRRLRRMADHGGSAGNGLPHDQVRVRPTRPTGAARDMPLPT